MTLNTVIGEVWIPWQGKIGYLYIPVPGYICLAVLPGYVVDTTLDPYSTRHTAVLDTQGTGYILI